MLAMKSLSPGLSLAVCGALTLVSPAAAQAPVIHATGWARAGVSSSAAYVTLHNGGRTADRLLGASSPAAASVSIHDSRNVGGVVRMRAAGPLALAPGAAMTMKPGGLHVMLTGLKAPLRPGTRLPLTLRFQRAGLVTINVPVMAPGATAPTAGHHDH